MRLPAKIIAIDRKIRTVGFYRTALLLLMHVRNLVFYRDHIIYFKDLTGDSLNNFTDEEARSAKAIHQIGDLTQDDILAISNYAGEQYIKTISARLKMNWTLYTAYIDEQLAGAAWVVPDFSEFKTRGMPYIDNSVSIIDCWTIPEHRGKSVYPSLLVHVAHRLGVNNVGKVFIEVNEKNHASIKGIEKAGFKRFTGTESGSSSLPD